MKKQKILWIIWGIIVVIVIILLTILGFMLSKNNQKYHDLEDKLKEAGEKYSTENFIFNENIKEFTITSEELGDYIDSLEVDNDKCTGYVKVTYDVAYEYKAYIKCNKYTTDGYKNYEK